MFTMYLFYFCQYRNENLLTDSESVYQKTIRWVLPLKLLSNKKKKQSSNSLLVSTNVHIIVKLIVFGD